MDDFFNNWFPFLAFWLSAAVLAWQQYRISREKRRRREDLLKRRPELRKHLE